MSKGKKKAACPRSHPAPIPAQQALRLRCALLLCPFAPPDDQLTTLMLQLSSMHCQNPSSCGLQAPCRHRVPLFGLISKLSTNFTLREHSLHCKLKQLHGTEQTLLGGGGGWQVLCTPLFMNPIRHMSRKGCMYIRF